MTEEEKRVMANKIRTLRDYSDVSLRCAASDMGIAFSTLHRIEKREVVPDLVTVIKIARYYGVSLDELCGLV